MIDSQQTSESNWRGDAWRLGLVVLLAIGVRTWTVANATMPSRDCVKFVRDALLIEQPPPVLGQPPIEHPSRLDVISHAEHPPGYPVAILGMSQLVRKSADPTVEEMALSAQLVSALAGVLLVIPFYFLTRRLFDRNTATAAVALFMVLPVCVEVTSDGISDGMFLLTAVSALWFAARAMERARPASAFGNGVAAGLCCGLGYLIRPDSLIVIAGIGLACAIVAFGQLRRRQTWRPTLLVGIGLVVGAIVLMAPYAVLIGRLTNKIAGNELFESLNGGTGKPTYFERGSSRSGQTPIASWWNPQSDADQSKPIWAVKALANEYLKTAHYAVPAFALLGLCFLGRRLADPRIALLVIVAAVYLASLWILAWKIGYVSQRHTLLSVLITCIFAGAGFGELGRVAVCWWKCGTPWQWGAIWAIVLIAVALPRDLRSLHEDRAGHKAAGKWIAEQNQPEYQLIDPFGWAEWYAGRSLRDVVTPSPYDGRKKYVVFEPNAKSPHSRLQYYDYARFMAVDPSHAPSEIVFRYPPGVPDDQIKVAVYLYQAPKPQVPQK